VNSTTVLPPAAPAPQATEQSTGAVPAAEPARLWARLRRHRETTPGTLQSLLVLLIVLAVVAGGAVALAARSAASGTAEVGQRIEPLLVDAESIYSSLADADATAAQAFLAGGLEPPALTRRYTEDLRRANTALTEAARRAPDGGGTAHTIGILSAGVSQYAGLVATARANNRQGYPVGASYLSAASRLNRDTLLPQARALLDSARRELAGGYTAARSNGLTAVAVLALLALLAGLLWTQRYLTRLTRRSINVPLAAATVLTLGLALAAGTVLGLQRSHLTAADTRGSAPVGTVAQARIEALRERGDEGLTLAARGGDGPYEVDFATASARLGGLLVQVRAQLSASGSPTAREATAAREASAGHQAYLARHAEIRALDRNGDYARAVTTSIGPDTTRIFESVTGALGRILDAKKATFGSEITRAGRGLGLLGVLGPVLALLAAALAATGIRARLEEYR
jgi:hypothetical protein